MVRLKQILAALELKIYCCQNLTDRPISGGYCGDMLSDVMANARTGELWVTNQAHPNIADVASVKELSGILLANNRAPYPDTLERAEREGVPIFGSSMTAFELVSRIGQIIAADRVQATV